MRDRTPAPAGLPPMPGWIRTGADFVTIKIHARPGAPRAGIIRVEERGLVAGVCSHAEKGKANEELADLIAKLSGVPRASVAIMQGVRARGKVVRLMTPHPAETAHRLMELALAEGD